MKIRKSLIPRSLALAAFLGCSAATAVVVDAVVPQHAAAQEVDDGYFYSSLAPHGQWFFQADFGWVWHPARVGIGWRPYTEGQWVWSDDVGWTWASQEPWGWATYHYGRWYFDPIYGWSWVPGRTWAPAWVSWRVDAGYIGWAPLWPVYFDLHPEYRWDRWQHDNDWDRRHQGRDWDRWVFTRDRDFTSSRVGRMAITDRRERDGIFSRSRDVTQFDESHPERIGRSIDRGMIEKAVGRPIRSVRIETVDKPVSRDDTRGDRLQVFRPRVKETPDKTPDRLGLAKEPSREARETDTIRQEKTRLDSVPEKAKGRGKSAAEPSVREKDNERGGAPAAIERGTAVEQPAPGAREGGGAADKGKADRGQRGAAGGKDKAAESVAPAATGGAIDDTRHGRPEQKTSPQGGAVGQPEHGQKKAGEPQREPKPRAQPGPTERMKPAPRAEQPSSQHEEPYVQPNQAPRAEQQRPPVRQQPEHVQPERTHQQPVQPERMHQQPVQPERTQPQHMQQAPRPQPERSNRQEPSMGAPEGYPHESRPSQPPPQVEHRGGPPQGQQGGAPQPQHTKPEANKKKPQSEDPNAPEPGRGPH